MPHMHASLGIKMSPGGLQYLHPKWMGQDFLPYIECQQAAMLQGNEAFWSMAVWHPSSSAEKLPSFAVPRLTPPALRQRMKAFLLCYLLRMDTYCCSAETCSARKADIKLITMYPLG